MRQLTVLLAIIWLAPCAHANTANSAGTIIRTFSRGETGRDWRIAPPILSADGSTLVLHVTAPLDKVDRTTIFDVASGRKIHEFSKPIDQMFRCLAADGKRAVALHQEGTVQSLQVVNLVDGRIVFEQPGAFGAALFTPDGKQLLVEFRPSYISHDLSVIDLQMRKTIGQVKTGQWDAVNQISSDSELLVTVDRNNFRVKIWDISTSDSTALEMRDHDAQTSLRFVRNGKAIR